MTGMKRDEREELVQRKGEVVAGYDDGGRLRAKLVREHPPGPGEANPIGATLMFHRGCYDAVRTTEPRLLMLAPHT